MNFFKKFLKRCRGTLESRRAVHHLMELDDQMLSDIGIQRGMIEHVVRNGGDQR